MKLNIINLKTIVLISIATTACSQPANVNPNIVNETILSSKLLTYDNLDLKYKDRHRYASYRDESGKFISFDPKESFFVRAEIDVLKLATVSFLYSCKSSSPCSRGELDKKIKENSFPYGKYINKWEFLSGDTSIYETKKFNGFDTIFDERSNDGNIDTVIIGPIPQKPTTLIVRPRGHNTDSFYISHEIGK